MKITYIEKGAPVKCRRVDHVRTVQLFRVWEAGGLLYGYRDRYNVMSIAKEDIVSIAE